MTELDPGVIDAILGRPDSELMKEALSKAQDTSLDEDARLNALDDLEMLVENIDNANDIEKLRMWEPLQGLLSASADGVKVQALWVIGTAMQNNPKAQCAYLALEPFPTLLAFLSPASRAPAKLRSKVIYALSGLLKHHAAALESFEASGGWVALRGALSDSDIGVRRKTAFLLSTLLFSPAAITESRSSTTTTTTAIHGGGTDSGAEPSVVHPNSHAALVADPSAADTGPATLRALSAHRLLPVVVRELVTPTPHGPDGEESGTCDTDLEERLARVLHTYVAVHGGTFDAPEKKALRAFMDTERPESAFGLSDKEVRALESAVAVA
jgi:hypothetical protein